MGSGLTEMDQLQIAAQTKPIYFYISVKANTDVNTNLRHIVSMLKEMVSEKESFHFLTCVSCLCCSNTCGLLPPVCEYCFELDGNTLFMVIVGDLLLTIIVMVIVYRCSKKKSSAGPPQPSKGNTSLGPITNSQFRQFTFLPWTS